jgi:hypothetical protein
MVSTRILIEPDGFVLVQILKAEVWRAGLLDNSLNHSVDRRIVSAFKLETSSATKLGCRAVNFAAHTL